MVTSLQNPMSVKSKMECISSSSAAYCGPTSGHQELARQKEKLKEKLEHCRCHLIKVWNGYYYFTTQKNYIWLLQPAPTKIDIFTQCWDVENRSASGCISRVPALARCWATKSGCAVLMVASASCRHPSCSEHPLITTCTAAPARYIQIPDTVHTTDTRASNEGSWRFHIHRQRPN